MKYENPNELRKAWLSNDKTWSQARKKEWGRINEKIKSRAFQFVRAHDNIKRLKSYFLTGFPPGPVPNDELDLHKYYFRPLAGIPGNILFECWLSPDHSKEYFSEVIERNPDNLVDSRNRFRKMVRDFFPEKEGTLFDGLESDFYLLLGGNRCRKDIEYPDIDDDEYKKRCHTHFNECLPIINRVLFAEPEDVNTKDIAHLMVAEFIDSYTGSFELVVNHEYEEGLTFKDYGLDEIRRSQLERCSEILKAEDKLHPRQIEIATQLLSSINELKLHEELEKVISPYLIDTINSHDA